jgi:NAD(P)-dependent dehydrogenase (short-subunit alcohol dehydrogenase family)
LNIDGRVAVVTGGASGIGRALCRALAEAGASGVVVSDINGEGAAAVAKELSDRGTKAIGVGTDVSQYAEVQALVAEAESAFGPIDIFCANAGIIVVGGPEVPEEDWDRIWSVNVKAHIFAARALLPSMLERGEGYIVTTASAAGLLTQLGSAPYSVTKHAAVSFAEWLSITYGERGIRVSCLCPQGVWTGMTGAPGGGDSAVASAPSSPDGPAGPPGRGTALADGILSAEAVADSVLEAIGEERFLILPHPEVATYEQRRAGDRERWLRGMRRAQAQIARLGR